MTKKLKDLKLWERKRRYFIMLQEAINMSSFFGVSMLEIIQFFFNHVLVPYLLVENIDTALADKLAKDFKKAVEEAKKAVLGVTSDGGDFGRKPLHYFLC